MQAISYKGSVSFMYFFLAFESQGQHLVRSLELFARACFLHNVCLMVMTPDH